MNKLKLYLKEMFLEWKQMWVGWNISRIKRKAEKLRKIEKSQMFVVKLDGRIRIISKRWFKEQRQQGRFPNSFTADKLKKISFYYTEPYHD